MINVKADVKEVTRHLTSLQKKQVPFATAVALTKTAQAVQKAEQKQLDKDIDRPTPFTKRAFTIKRATKRKWEAQVIIKDIQFNYLKYQIYGGTRPPKNKMIPVPTRNLKLNKYGNMTRNKIRTLLAQKNTFSGVVNGVPGIWKRYKSKPPVLLVAFEPQVKYSKRFKFIETADKTVKKTFTKRLNIELYRAIKTAR